MNARAVPVPSEVLWDLACDLQLVADTLADDDAARRHVLTRATSRLLDLHADAEKSEAGGAA